MTKTIHFFGRTYEQLAMAGFGQLDFIHCLSNSSNVCFYKLGGGYKDEIPEGLGICRLGTYARALGYGNFPGVELPLVENGLIPDPTWKRLNQGQNWSTGDTYIASVGQGFVIATPIQVLLSATTIANDGVLMRPTILREITDSDGHVIKSFLPDRVWDITKDPLIDVFNDPTSPGGCENKFTGEKKTVQPWVVDLVQEGMRLAVLEGTLRREFQNVTIAAAGKTGTAEYCDKYANEKNLCIPGNWPTHAWTYTAPAACALARRSPASWSSAWPGAASTRKSSRSWAAPSTPSSPET